MRTADPLAALVAAGKVVGREIGVNLGQLVAHAPGGVLRAFDDQWENMLLVFLPGEDPSYFRKGA